jgi:uroporphyrinogen-III synthase
MRSESPHPNLRYYDRLRPRLSRPVQSCEPRNAPKAVLVTRAAGLSPPCLTRLRARGRPVLQQPLLQTQVLTTDIPATSDYQAVIVSSGIALDMLAAASPARELPLYVVGAASARAAEKVGFVHITSAATAASLAAKIRADLDPEEGLLLYVAGKHRARDMSRLLSGFAVELVEAYAAQQTQRFSAAIRKALKRGRVNTVTIYSARAAVAFVAAARRGGVARQARQATAICLSPRIAAVMRSQGWRKTLAVQLPETSRIESLLLAFDPSRLTTVRAESGSAPTVSAPVVLASVVTPTEAVLPASVRQAPSPTRSQPFPPQPSPSLAVTPSEPPMSSSAQSPPPPATAAATGGPGPHWPAFIGLVIVALVGAYALWQSGQTQSAALQQQLDAMQKKVDTVAADPGKVERQALAAKADALSAKADQLVTTVTQLEPKIAAALGNQAKATDAKIGANTGAIGALQAGVTTANTATAAIANTLSSTATKAELSAIESQMAGAAEKAGALEVSLKTAADRIDALDGKLAEQSQTTASISTTLHESDARLAKVEAWASGVQPARLAERLVALSELRTVVDSGAPFAAAFARAKNAVDAAGASTDSWLDFATTGILPMDRLVTKLTKIERGLPSPRANASGNSVVDAALGVLLSGVRIEGKDSLVNDPNRAAIASAQTALAAGDVAAVNKALAPIEAAVPAIAEWRAVFEARLAAKAAMASWENAVLAKVGESVQ